MTIETGANHDNRNPRSAWINPADIDNQHQSPQHEIQGIRERQRSMGLIVHGDIPESISLRRPDGTGVSVKVDGSIKIGEHEFLLFPNLKEFGQLSEKPTMKAVGGK